MVDPFHSPERRLARAKNKLGKLISRGKIFSSKRPYAFVSEDDPKTNRTFYKFRFTKRLPAGTQDHLAWEIVEELRSVLDQIGYACAVLSGKVAPKNTYFPIADSAAKLETDVIGRGRCKDIPPDILNLFRSFKPYQGGNNAIWTLNRLCNSNKHRFIIPSGTTADHAVGINALLTPPDTHIYAPFWDREKGEMVVLSTPTGAEVKYDLQFSAYIAFDEVEPVTGQPVIPILHTMSSEVEGILLATEAECRRIGLIR